MTIGLRVPPKCAATRLVDRNGTLPAQAQPAWYMLSTFADRSLLPFSTRTVVAPDVEDERIVTQAKFLQSVHQLANLGVGMFDEPGEDFHQPALAGSMFFWNASPRGYRLVPGCQFCVRWDPTELLLTLDHPLAVGIPAVVEFDLVLVGPFGGDMVWPVYGAGSPVHQERFVRRKCLVLLQSGDYFVGHVLGQVVLLVMRWLNGGRVFKQARLPLRRFAGNEAIEVVEAMSGGPAIAGRCRR